MGLELGGGLVGGQKVVVLRQQEHGLRCSCLRAVRLQRWVLQLGGWLVVRQEGVVLRQQEDGVPGLGAYGRQEGVIRRSLVRPRLTADCTWNLTFGQTIFSWRELLVMMMGCIQRKQRRLSLCLWSLWQHISPTRQIFSWCAQGDAAMAGGKGTQAHSVLSQHHYHQLAGDT